ncbi:hypothetical protein BCR43DRAFT_484552 [Syncephalastrum racemosum]|uniref:SET domain-containing protein n=1 Tax=Syncephalastrum racemosum TaxID=13706 RepID=A0A1X2HKX7_SYNRA|nr:hypothetical protein BCR43DRAFT_484552 [Syncephalastrum racemosum]
MPSQKDFVALHAAEDINSKTDEKNALLRIASLPGKGRGFVAVQPIPAGTCVQIASPLAAVVSQEWIPETCGWCFAFSYPKRMRVKFEKDLSFCSEPCRDEYVSEHNNIAAAHRALDHAFRHGVPSHPHIEQITEEDEDEEDGLSAIWHKGLQGLTPTAELSNADRTMARLIATVLSNPLWQEELAEVEDNERAFFERHDEEDQADVMRLYLFIARALETTPVAARLSTAKAFRFIYFREMSNSFGLWEGTGEQGVTDDQELLGWGIYPSAVYFNHSCEPNVIKLRRGRYLQFVTTRDIQAGEEACIAYGSVEDPTTERRKRLLEHYHFWCTCTRCNREAS